MYLHIFHRICKWWNNKKLTFAITGNPMFQQWVSVWDTGRHKISFHFTIWLVFKVLISFTRYHETSPKRYGGEEREAKKISSKTQAQKIEYEAQARKRSYETQAQRISSEKRRLAQEEIERFEEK